MSTIDDFLNPPDTYQSLTVERVIVSLMVTFLLSLFIFYIYRKTFKGVLYTRNFNVGLVMIALVTTLIIMPISSNVALSLGMVGALSIVRFRTAIKDPIDIMFTFWAIAVGITIGAGLFMVALVGCPIIGLFVFILCKVDFRGAEPYLLVVHFLKDEQDNEIEAAIHKIFPERRLRSRTVTGASVELMAEVRLKPEETPQVDKLLELKGVKDAALVSYNGDYVT